jgi:hypothetical protein
MSEEKTHSFDADSTNPLPFDDFVRQHLALLLKAQTEMREKQERLEESQKRLEENQDKLREEMIERFVQLSQQGLRQEALIVKIREEIRDLDYKVGPFIKEQINFRRSLDEVRERVGLETY